jgi:hypothetical protein
MKKDVSAGKARSSRVRRVYVLGAGASAPYGLPLLRSLTWELAQSLGRSSRTLFISALHECFGQSPRGPHDSPDFEEFLNRLDPRALRYLEAADAAKASLRPKAAELALRSLRTFIRDKCLSLAKCHGPYDRLVQAINDDTIVISFNWDVLLELAFRRARRAYSYFPSSNSASGSALLLKPHGSINWFALLQRQGIHITGRSNVRPIGNLSNFLCHIAEPLQLPRFGGRGTMLQASLATVPAIVPPAASKLLSVGGVPGDGFVEAGHTSAMKAIWATASNALESAREIVIIGYSMPGTDAASIAMLKHAAALRSRRLTHVFLVDPCKDVEERYRDVLRIDAQLVCNDFANFDPSKRLLHNNVA